MNIIYTYK